jgi:hypothetical protein
MAVSYFMNFARTSYVGKSLAVTVMILSALTSLRAHPPSAEIVKMFPWDLGGFHQLQSMRPLLTLAKQGILQPEYFAANADANHASPFLGAEAEYLSTDGEKLLVEIVRLGSDSAAYSLFTVALRNSPGAQPETVRVVDDVGTASVVTAQGVIFFKGATFARVTTENGKNSDHATALARLLAATFDKGEGEIPVLVKHLPDWQSAERSAIYAVNIGPLRDAIPNQSVLNELSFEGGTEAVSANYGQSQLVIVEFTTPQFAGDNDRRIIPRIQELKSQGQPVPTAYRRVGNYSVFVFNAPDEKAANQLIDQVKYEQVVQWLGDDPHLFARLQRLYAQTSAGVFVAVLETSGLALLLCLGIGSLLGAILFRHRRAQQRQAAAYSDAGGMVRLNLDEMTGTGEAHRLLEPGKQSESAGT